jgi:hypothetical protein
MSTFALVVGIEKYDQPCWDVVGPCANAIEMAKLLVAIGFEPGNIHMFLDPARDLDGEISGLIGSGIRVNRSGGSTGIDTFCRTELAKDCAAYSQLLVFWSGHGCTSGTGDRIFFCRDYTEKLYGRVFNGTNFLRRLRTADYSCFTEQIFLADVCGVYVNVPLPDGRENVRQIPGARQFAFYATPAGQYAHGSEGRGAFTNAVLGLLKQAGTWPDYQDFADSLTAVLKRSQAAPFRISVETPDSNLETIVGANTDFHAAIGLLSGLDIVSDVLQRHYERTVGDLGNPELARVQDLTGMVHELSSLCDGTVTKGIPHGLLQFLMRLASEQDLKDEIDGWLEAHASAQRNTRREIQEKLQLEARQKVLIVDVEVNEQRELTSYKPYLCNIEFAFVAGSRFERRTVRDWDDFTQGIQELLKEFTVGDHLNNLEIHFLVDPPLFDRPFHLIPFAPDGGPIGDEAVVVLRHRQRILSADLRLRSVWRDYANALRQTRPGALKWLRIDSGNTPLPREKGPWFTGFTLPLVTRGATSDNEKRIVDRLLRLGAPYLYLAHQAPAGADWSPIANGLTDLLGGLTTLNEFPAKFMEERIRLSEHATHGSLLWDDPLSNPFSPTEGVDVG